jgi:hypothetical protein
MIDDFHRNLPPPGSEARQQDPNSVQLAHAQDSTMTTTATSGPSASSSKRPSKHGTLNSQISNWSAASSAASFDYQPAANGGSPSVKKSKSSDLPSVTEANEQILPQGERIPPEGAHSPTNNVPFVQRIEVKASNDQVRKRSPSPQKRSKPERRKSSVKDEVADLLKPPTNGESDDFSNLRKLISEGRIAGLNEKPPSFVPPTPPTAARRSSVDRSAASSRRPSSAKPPAPSTPKSPKATHSAERQPSRKSREAPKPPGAASTPPPVDSIQFMGSRQRESMEDLTDMDGRKRNEVKRSSSNHGTRPSGMYLSPKGM